MPIPSSATWISTNGFGSVAEELERRMVTFLRSAVLHAVMHKVRKHLPQAIAIPRHHPRTRTNLLYQDLPAVPRGDWGEAGGNLLGEISKIDWSRTECHFARFKGG